MTQPLPYMHPATHAKDLSHLRTLAICHYVWGGLIMLISCMGLIHVGLGVGMLSDKQQASAAVIFIIAGAAIILVGWTVGILNIIAGRGLAQQRYRILSFVMAGINCGSFPLGTLIGVFTFIVLCRDSVKQLYQPPAGGAPDQAMSIPVAQRG